MRIIFLCSSLEPGRDGVGDYTRLLAQECVRQGQQCAIIALHDRHITDLIESEISLERAAIPLLRLPAATPWPKRTSTARAFCARFHPAWFSLQFVPYGFNKKGIIVGLTKRLLAICGDSPKIHIMFHELWIGEGGQSPLTHRLIGAIQRWFILDMIRGLKPAVIHTHTPAYVTMLHRAGCAASLLPLFGNIPIIDAPNIEWLYKKLASLDSAENFVRDRSGFWMLGFFGALHRQWKPEPFFTILRRAAHKAGKRVCLLSIGRLGAGEIHWDQFALKYEKDFYFLKLGEQPAERISQFLQYVDLGVAASTWQLIGKSGTASAMLDHGLPVIVTRDEVQSLDAIDVSPPIHALLHRCDPSLEMKLAAGITKQPPRHRAEGTTARFLAPLLCCL